MLRSLLKVAHFAKCALTLRMGHKVQIRYNVRWHCTFLRMARRDKQS